MGFLCNTTTGIVLTTQSVLILAFICALLSLHSSSSLRSNTFISSLSLRCSDLPLAVLGDLKLSGSCREIIFSCSKNRSRQARVLFLRVSRWKARRSLRMSDTDGSLLDSLLWERYQNKAWGEKVQGNSKWQFYLYAFKFRSCMYVAFIHVWFY